MHGETVRTLRQTHGRGRNGRTWSSSEGAGLTFSVALRSSLCALPPEYQGSIAALALAVFLERHGLNPRLKWPNDVLVNDRKIAGILSESGSDASNVVVVGLGCNINQTIEDFNAVGLQERATSVFMSTGRRHDLDTLFADLLATWQTTIETTNGQGLATLVGDWRRRDMLPGRKIVVMDGNRRIEGVALNVDCRMALVIQDEMGRKTTLHSGEVAHIESF